MVVFRTVGRRSNCIYVFVFKSSGEYVGVWGSSSIHCSLESSGQADQRELLCCCLHCSAATTAQAPWMEEVKEQPVPASPQSLSAPLPPRCYLMLN